MNEKKKIPISIRIPEELNIFIESYAKDNFMTKTDVLIGFIVNRYKFYQNEKNKNKDNREL